MTATRYEMSTRECVELLQGGSIGRMCVIDFGYPLAIPINYRLARTDDGARIAVRTSPTSMLGRYEGLASLEVDDVSLEHGRAWSVIVRGTLRRAQPGHDLPDPEPLLEFDRSRWLALEPSAWSGRRFVVESTADPLVVDWQMAPV